MELDEPNFWKALHVLPFKRVSAAYLPPANLLLSLHPCSERGSSAHRCLLLGVICRQGMAEPTVSPRLPSRRPARTTLRTGSDNADLRTEPTSAGSCQQQAAPPPPIPQKCRASLYQTPPSPQPPACLARLLPNTFLFKSPD